jgi:hypothetical protein
LQQLHPLTEAGERFDLLLLAASFRHCYEVFKRQVPLQTLFATGASRRHVPDTLTAQGMP